MDQTVDVTNIYKELLRTSVFKRNLLSGFFVCMIFFNCSLACDEGSITTFSYMHVGIFSMSSPLS